MAKVVASLIVAIGVAVALSACGGGDAGEEVACGDVVPGEKSGPPDVPMTGHLSIADSTLSQGDPVTFRVVNTGKVLFAYGAPFRVERMEGGSWEGAGMEVLGKRHAWTLEGRFTEPGHSSEPEKLLLPDDVQPGFYRLTRSVSDRLRLGRPHLLICGEFRVRSSPTHRSS